MAKASSGNNRRLAKAKHIKQLNMAKWRMRGNEANINGYRRRISAIGIKISM